MVSIIYILLIAPWSTEASSARWDSPDILIEDSLGSFVDFAVDYNYSNGNIYVACIPDSGTYFGPDSMGILLFRSTDHGANWDIIFRDAYQAFYWELKEIDLVATRNDTVYVLMSWYHEVPENDQLNIAKIWDWNIDWLLTPAIDATEIRSPKLVRDDFDDFHLYIAYLDITAENDSLIILRSTDRGYNWSNLLRANSAAEWQDHDIAVADSSFYHLSTFQYSENQTLQLTYWRERCNPLTCEVKNLLSVNTNNKGQIHYPRIGATTTLPDTTQLVYTVYSEENLNLGNYDLLYLYSEKGGNDWPIDPDTLTPPDTLVQGSEAPVFFDIRGYQVSPNPYMDITYCMQSTVPLFTNYFRWSSESDPTNWHDTTYVTDGTFFSYPELVYSPGSPASGAGVVYNDYFGRLWFDAPWHSGVAEDTDINKKKIGSQIVLKGSSVQCGSVGATVYDLTGRKIVKLNTNSWDLRDADGKEVKVGIYFIIERNGSKSKLSVIK